MIAFVLSHFEIPVALRKSVMVCFYKERQLFVSQSATRGITKRNNFISKYDRYCEVFLGENILNSLVKSVFLQFCLLIGTDITFKRKKVRNVINL